MIRFNYFTTEVKKKTLATKPTYDMKKLILLLLFIPLVFACSSDSDNDSTCLTCTNVDFDVEPYNDGTLYPCYEDLEVCEGDYSAALCFGPNVSSSAGTPLESWEIDAIKSFYESNGASCSLE